MENNLIIDRINEIFRDVFDNNDLVIKLSTVPEEVDGWDSLQHLNLVSSIENEFGLKFSLEEIEKLASVKDFVALLEDKLK